MTIAPDLAARIRRLYEVEHWRVGTIATQLHVHRDTVRRVLREQGSAPAGAPLRRSLLEPYRDFIVQTLEKYPTLTASRLFDMVCERGYAGQRSHFRHLVSTLRPRAPAEAFLRLRTPPGEQMQIDWAHFGHLQIGQARRPLMGFVAVLSYSRRVFLRFCLNAQMDSFLRGHVQAFCAFGGLARTPLYDNLKSVVLERVGDAIRFNPECLAFAAHYRFEPRPVAICRGNEKGRGPTSRTCSRACPPNSTAASTSCCRTAGSRRPEDKTVLRPPQGLNRWRARGQVVRRAALNQPLKAGQRRTQASTIAQIKVTTAVMGAMVARRQQRLKMPRPDAYPATADSGS